jgi:hypothetical protein
VIVAATNETLRPNIPPLGWRQSPSKPLAGRHTKRSGSWRGGERPNVAAYYASTAAVMLPRSPRHLLAWWRKCRLWLGWQRGQEKATTKEQRKEANNPISGACFVCRATRLRGGGETPTKQGADRVRKQQRSRGRRRRRGVCK